MFFVHFMFEKILLLLFVIPKIHGFRVDYFKSGPSETCITSFNLYKIAFKSRVGLLKVLVPARILVGGMCPHMKQNVKPSAGTPNIDKIQWIASI